MTRKRKTEDVKKDCIICGKEFTVRIRLSDRLIMTRCFHSMMSVNWFTGWTYGYKDDDFHNDIEVHFKNRFWQTLGYTKIQREIVYWIWTQLFKKKKIEYWECPKCCDT